MSSVPCLTDVGLVASTEGLEVLLEPELPPAWLSLSQGPIARGQARPQRPCNAHFPQKTGTCSLAS